MSKLRDRSRGQRPQIAARSKGLATSAMRTEARRDRDEALRALNRRGPMIYAIRLEDGLIKIGCSTNVAARCKQLGGELVAIAFGGWNMEAWLHRTLRPYAARGREYYEPHPEVIRVVDELATTMEPHP